MKQKSWIRRNWMWLLAVWLGLALTGAAIGFIALQNSEARQMAIARANASPALAARLGQPLKFGWFSWGEWEVNEAGGHAELAIAVSGPKGKGTLYLEARKTAGFWHLNTLDFGDGLEADTIDLLSEAPAGSAPKQ
jgi:hypothetical protein